MTPPADLRRQLEDASRSGGGARPSWRGFSSSPRPVPGPAPLVLSAGRLARRGRRGGPPARRTSASARRTCTGSPRAPSPASSPSRWCRRPAPGRADRPLGAPPPVRRDRRPGRPQDGGRRSRPACSRWSAWARRWPSARAAAPSTSSCASSSRCWTRCRRRTGTGSCSPTSRSGPSAPAGPPRPTTPPRCTSSSGSRVGRRGVPGRVPILYGGSVNAGNVLALLARPELDGVLVGGASLDAGRLGRAGGTGAALAVRFPNHSPRRSRRIDLEERLQAAVGDHYRILRELGGGGMSRVFLAEEVRPRPPGRHQAAAARDGRRASTSSGSSARSSSPPACSTRTSFRSSPPAPPATCCTTSCRSSRASRSGSSWRAKASCPWPRPCGSCARWSTRWPTPTGTASSTATSSPTTSSSPRATRSSPTSAWPRRVSASSGGALAHLARRRAGHAGLHGAGAGRGRSARRPSRRHLRRRARWPTRCSPGGRRSPRRPPQALLAAQITQAPEPVAQHRRTVPPALNAVIMRCLEKRAADRWQSAAELVPQLDAMSTPSCGHDAGDGASRRSQPAPSRRSGVGIRSGSRRLFVAALRWWSSRSSGAGAAAGAARLGAVRRGGPAADRSAHHAHDGLQRAPARGGADDRAGRAGSRDRSRGLAHVAEGAAGRRARVRRRWPLVAAAYTAMRLLGIGPVGTLVASGVLKDREPLVLADFENRTADSTLGTVAHRGVPGRPESVAHRAAARRLGIADALQRMERAGRRRLPAPLARELAEREGIKGVVMGQIDPVGKGYVLSASLVGARRRQCSPPSARPPRATASCSVRSTGCRRSCASGSASRWSRSARPRRSSRSRPARCLALDEVLRGAPARGGRPAGGGDPAAAGRGGARHRLRHGLPEAGGPHRQPGGDEAGPDRGGHPRLRPSRPTARARGRPHRGLLLPVGRLRLRRHGRRVSGRAQPRSRQPRRAQQPRRSSSADAVTSPRRRAWWSREPSRLGRGASFFQNAAMPKWRRATSRRRDSTLARYAAKSPSSPILLDQRAPMSAAARTTPRPPG